MSRAAHRHHVYVAGDPVVFRRAGRGFGAGTVSAVLPCGSLVVDVPGESPVRGEPAAFRPCAGRAQASFTHR